jgi:serine/threonine-protein kinase
VKRFVEGLLVGGRYELLGFIAAGGMGDVWRARDTVLSRTVALKIMRPDTVAEPVFAERFREEAQFTAGLSHHNIATTFDYGLHENIAFLVMEYVDGESLSSMVRREGALAPDEVRSIIGQMALALGAAHDAGVIHRDVKPANVLVTPEGTVKLTDFGIARAVGSVGLTRTGETLGTPFYLSPEQALGKSATKASDVYALGVVAHELLTGRRPFDRDTPVATAIAHVTDPMPALPEDIPAELTDIISRCLDKEPKNRPAHVHEVATAMGLSWVEIPTARIVAPSPQRPRTLVPEARLVDILVPRKGRVLVIGARALLAAVDLGTLGHRVWGVDASESVVKELNDAPVEESTDSSLATTGGTPREKPQWVAIPNAAHATREALGVASGFDAVLWSGGGLLELSRLERGDAFRALAPLCAPGGRIVVEFDSTPEYTYPEFRDDFLAAGLVPDLGFSGWDLRPMVADSETTIVILSRR